MQSSQKDGQRDKQLDYSVICAKGNKHSTDWEEKDSVPEKMILKYSLKQQSDREKDTQTCQKQEARSQDV